MRLKGEKRAFIARHFGNEYLARIERQLEGFSADLSAPAGGLKNTSRPSSPVAPYLAQLQRSRHQTTPAAAGKALREPQTMLDLLNQPALWR